MVSVGDWAVDIQASSSDAERAQGLARAVAETVRPAGPARAPDATTAADSLLLRCFDARRYAAGWVRRRICLKGDGTLEIRSQREAGGKLGSPAGEQKIFPGAWRVTGDQLILCEANGLRSQASYQVAADGLHFGDEKWTLAP